MNKITIKADGPCEVTLNGERMIAPGTLVRVADPFFRTESVTRAELEERFNDRLTTDELEVGKAYKLVGSILWEPVE